MDKSDKPYDDIVNLVKNKTKDISVDQSLYLGYLLIVTHTIFITMLILYCFVGTINNTYYILLALLSIIMLLLHYRFNGCILIRIERELLHSSTYSGIWDAFYYFLIDDTLDKNIIYNRKHNIQICIGSLLIFSIFLRILFHMK